MKLKLIYTISLITVITIAALFLRSGLIADIQNSERFAGKGSYIQSEGFRTDSETEESQGSPGENEEFEEHPFVETKQDFPKEEKLWKDIEQMPKEQDMISAVTNPWKAIGPYGSVTDRRSKFTGRVLDMHIENGNLTSIASATGGLWAARDSMPVPLSDQVPSLVASTFDVKPGSPNNIVLGTGEEGERGGRGFFRTTNGGTNWLRSLMLVGRSDPSAFHKLRFDPHNSNILHAATNEGYFRSTNAGANWTRYFDGDVSDIAFHPQDANLLYIGVWEHNNTGVGGVYKSTDGGNSWGKMTVGGIPVSDVGRTSICICESNPNFIYVLMADKGGKMLGVFRSPNAGINWSKISPPEDILGTGFGWYVGSIDVSPSNPGIVLAGGIWLWRSTNYGATWSVIDYFKNEPDIHSDIHTIQWSGRNRVWVGHDGGTSFSDDDGMTFSTAKNNWPITQYVHFDVAASNPNVIFGGSRDNAFTGTTNGGISWTYAFNGPADGSGFAIDPNDPQTLYGTLGELGGNWRFGHFRSTNAGRNWDKIDNGIAPTREFYTKIRTNNIAPINVYTQSGGQLYFSLDKGTNWIPRNTVPFVHEIEDFTIRDYDPSDPDQIIYVTLKSSDPANRIKFQQNRSNFQERSSGIPAGISIRKVVPDPKNINFAYALLNPNNDDKMIYRTTNKGVNWINIDGNLPDVTVRDLIASPADDSTLYLATETGCFKTTSMGAKWFRWNDGMPEAAIVTEMKYTPAPFGSFNIYVCTYGRGIWIRNETNTPLPTDGSSSTKPLNGTGTTAPDKFRLYQNFPNPFNPVTKIRFDIPEQSQAKITVYDISGREIAILLDKQVRAGSYETEFDAARLASGMYFYVLKAGSYTEVKKMVLVK